MTLRRTSMALALAVAGVCLGSASGDQQGKAEEKKGIVAEVQDQNNERIKLELREIGPSYKPDSSVLRFTKQLAPTLDEVAWFEIALQGDLNLREIRVADEPLKFKAPDGKQYFFYPVVIVPKKGTTSSWLWHGETLSGVVRGEGKAPRPFSIAIKDVKVVRFAPPPQS
ncbi:MAG TPA: hypothetical protein VMW27_03260 [Thermoanaerobaculia bacterium]|nr:hypothetical protein [Thermoanaerobaculia bacterium]